MNLKNRHSTLMFIIAITISAGGTSQNNFGTHDFRLSTNTAMPIHYTIKLIPYYNMYDSNEAISKNYNPESWVEGECAITINILKSTQSIQIDAISLVTNLETMLFTRDELVHVLQIYAKPTPHTLVFRSKDTIFPGIYTWKMHFTGVRNYDSAEGFFKSSHVTKGGDREWVIVTNIQTIGARRLFPCWDDPQLRTTFDISVKHFGNSYALSNMPRRYTEDWFDYMIWTHFYTTPLISTHHVAITVTNFTPIRINKNISLWCRKYSKEHFSFAMHVIENITSYMNSQFRELQIIPKIDHFVIPNFPQDGTSKWGLIFYREADVIYNKRLDPVMHKIEVARCIAHKIAYQVFGNIVSPLRWSYLWLHDGLATIFGEEATAQAFNNYGIMDFFIVRNQYEALNLDSHFDMNPPQVNLSEINSLFNFPRYMKVPIVLRMLKNMMFDHVLRKGVDVYLNKYLFNSVVPQQFWSTQNRQIQWMQCSVRDFSSWIDYRHYPIMTVTQIHAYGGKLTQNLNMSYGKCRMSTYKYAKLYLLRSTLTELTPQEPSLYSQYNIDNRVTVIDILHGGYYRVKYDDRTWDQIAKYLNSLAYKNISAINRAKMIDDAFYFVITHQLNISTFWKLSSYLRQETDFVAWYPMIKIFEYVSNVIPFYGMSFLNTHNSTSFIVMQALKELLDNSFEILRSVPENVFIKCLKEEISRWACTLHYGPCLIMARKKLLLHFEDPSSNIISPGWKEWTYCQGLLEANISERIISKEMWLTGELLPYLPCTRNPSVVLTYFLSLQKYSQHAKRETSRIRRNINIFHLFIAKHANNSILTKNLMFITKIMPKEISTIVAVTDIVNHVYSEKHLNEMLHELQQRTYVTDGQLISKIQRKIQTRSSQIRDQMEHYQFLYSQVYAGAPREPFIPESYIFLIICVHILVIAILCI